MAIKKAVRTEDRKKLDTTLIKAGVRPEMLKTEVRLTRSTSNVNRADLDEKIRRKAYEIFLRNGRQHGNDLAHWFEAEKQVKAVVR